MIDHYTLTLNKRVVSNVKCVFIDKENKWFKKHKSQAHGSLSFLKFFWGIVFCGSYVHASIYFSFLAGNYMFKVNNRNSTAGVKYIQS